jgi:mono/diheme cytochrome c family protein
VLPSVVVLLGLFVNSTLAQNVGSRPPAVEATHQTGVDEPGLSPDAPSVAVARTGEELYMEACANCHGPDGTGAQANVVGLPIQPPDFTESRFASREPAADWAGVVTLGGPVRGFDRLMPAFGDALTRDEVDRILTYVQTLYEDKSWPRGEFNLPLPLATEKAYPEDEYVFQSTVGTGDAASVMTDIIYEKRFGAQNQVEVKVPFGWQELTGPGEPNAGEWAGGLGDVAVGLKRVLVHSMDTGSIASLTFEAILPTGDESEGFGNGYVVLEPFVTFAQFLPLESFVQMQTGVEFPTDTDHANEGLFRVALGRTFTPGGPWARAWSPMVEFLAARELEEDATTVWDVLPQMQVTLNQRQHIMANVGVRLPLTETEGRDPQILVYLLWDWFDGGFFEGW